jgi:hypothetical protein
MDSSHVECTFICLFLTQIAILANDNLAHE